MDGVQDNSGQKTQYTGVCEHSESTFNAAIQQSVRS